MNPASSTTKSLPPRLTVLQVRPVCQANDGVKRCCKPSVFHVCVDHTEEITSCGVCKSKEKPLSPPYCVRCLQDFISQGISLYLHFQQKPQNDYVEALVDEMLQPLLDFEDHRLSLKKRKRRTRKELEAEYLI